MLARCTPHSVSRDVITESTCVQLVRADVFVRHEFPIFEK